MHKPKIQQLNNICGFFLQLEERMKADCYPNIAVHARRQYLKYNDRLEILKFENQIQDQTFERVAFNNVVPFSSMVAV
ncbi:hypothetical protein BK126_05350 [Paenibacillus sp. FSL H7-0326]|uniref:hypothetical protein n=1 Tax=Paenibacillus sp. FSL H7-0326 TaxID=1921144 RepID=UPI00096C3408|nr:hypothetical protein [Paenibacillus sp. FSL H7-0326]OMC71505.1 hypothetical protein BK126_05350 [Paenibacillus sp. FSL H7-0326]